MDRTDEDRATMVPVGFAYFVGAVGFGIGAIAATGWMSWWVAAPYGVVMVLGAWASPRS